VSRNEYRVDGSVGGGGGGEGVSGGMTPGEDMRVECGRIVEKVGELFGLPTDPDTMDGDGVRSCCTRCD